MAKKPMTIGFVTAGKKLNSTSVVRSSLSKPQGKANSKSAAGAALNGGKMRTVSRSSNTGTVVLEKPGKGGTSRESRQGMLKELDGAVKRVAGRC